MANKFSLLGVSASIRLADVMIVMVAASLPWSTSLPAIFVCLWLLVLLPAIDLQALQQLSKHPACIFPLLLFALAVIGTTWASVPWTTRLYYVGPLAKLLTIPLLIYHFQRSNRGLWVFLGFLISCILLMILSWVVAIDPRFALKSSAAHGVPVKNYIDQSQEFGLCAVVLAYPIVQFFRQRRFEVAAFAILAVAGFIANMMFVAISRTALVTLPVLFGFFALMHLTRRRMMLTLGLAAAVTAALWFASPNLRERSDSLFFQYNMYMSSNLPTSVGLRLEYWKKALQFFVEAPLIGHGTGAVQSLFSQSAVGEEGPAAEVVANPHNQTLYTAIQWGTVGTGILWGLWISHLLLFRGGGLAHWIGLMVVAQNMMSSLFNSHLFDFHEGWMYIVGVGVAGGMVLSKHPTQVTYD